jgi:hypothetical protein
MGHRNTHVSHTCEMPLIPNDTIICFAGDSLARQFAIQTACTWGHGHKYHVDKHVYLHESKIDKSHARIRYDGILCHLPATDDEIRQRLGECTYLVLSKGAWHINNPTFSRSPLEFGSLMRDTVGQLRRVLPSTRIFLKEMWAWGGKECRTDDANNQKVVQFNEKMQNVAQMFHRVRFLNGLHNISLMYNCEEDHPKYDTVHWCHKNSHVLDGSVCLLAEQINTWRKKSR